MSAFEAEALRRDETRPSGIAGRLNGGVAPGASHHRPTIQALDEEENVENFEAFGWLRGVKDRAIMLQLRKRTGYVLALPYAWIEFVEFDPSVGIVIACGSYRVEIRGHNLDSQVERHRSLFAGITGQRVPWVKESARRDIIQNPAAASVNELVTACAHS